MCRAKGEFLWTPFFLLFPLIVSLCGFLLVMSIRGAKDPHFFLSLWEVCVCSAKGDTPWTPFPPLLLKHLSFYCFSLLFLLRIDCKYSLNVHLKFQFFCFFEGSPCPSMVGGTCGQSNSSTARHGTVPMKLILCYIFC